MAFFKYDKMNLFNRVNLFNKNIKYAIKKKKKNIFVSSGNKTIYNIFSLIIV